MFVRFLENKQLTNSKKIGAEWGGNCRSNEQKFPQKQREDESKATWVIDRYVFTGVAEMVEKASDCIVQINMVLVADVLLRTLLVMESYLKTRI